ncbi:hypothetical protein D3C86_1729160 [compost metagenome]
MQGVDEQQDQGGGARMITLEVLAQVVGQMRVEQGIGHHPQNVVAEMPGVGAGSDARGHGDIGQCARVVFAQRWRRQGVEPVLGNGVHAVETIPADYPTSLLDV